MKILTMSLTFLVFLSLCISGYAADCNNGGRYEDNGDGTVTDCRGGLIWLKDANCTDTSVGIVKNTGTRVGALTWYDAVKWAAGLGNSTCGLTDGSDSGDWRLPTQEEWMAMIASANKQGMTDPRLTDGTGVGHWTAGNPNNIFTNVQTNWSYWAGTTLIGNPSVASSIFMSTGLVPLGSKISSLFYVWPVRGSWTGSYGYLFIE